ncbi:MAG: DNA primase, partial [Sulfurovum sp.]|nr:DNA primase [Sulfurovum sp.]
FGAMKQYLDTLSPIIKDAYIPEAATLLGLSPSFFGKGAKPERARENFSQKRDDVAQLSILKTLIETPAFIDNVLSVMDVTMFGNYAGLLTALIEGQHEHPGLVGLSVDESFAILDEAELNNALRNFLIKHYDLKLKSIAGSPQIPFEKKSYLIRKIRTDIIPRLKKGELVAFDPSL